MSFVKDFLIATGVIAVGLEISRRKDVRDYASLLGVSEKEAARRLDDAVERIAAEKASKKAEKAQRMAEAREAIRNAKGLRASFKVWVRAINLEVQLARQEAQGTHR